MSVPLDWPLGLVDNSTLALFNCRTRYLELLKALICLTQNKDAKSCLLPCSKYGVASRSNMFRSAYRDSNAAIEPKMERGARGEGR